MPAGLAHAGILDELPLMKLLYIADPMCSWCWGFSPVISALTERYGDRASVEVIMGGLRAGNTMPMDEAAKVAIRQHWEHVQEASGQPFDFAFFDREGFVYDTEPACRAVVATRGLDSELTLPFLARLHEAFYAENRDVTSLDTLVELAGELGIEREGFRGILSDEKTRSAAADDFLLSARMGVRGFPTLVGDDSKRKFTITSGFRPLSDLVTILDRWFDAPEE